MGCISTTIFILFVATIMFFAESEYTLKVHRNWIDSIFKKNTKYNELFKGGVIRKTRTYAWAVFLSISLCLFIVKATVGDLLILGFSIFTLCLLLMVIEKAFTSQLVDRLRKPTINRFVSYVNTLILSALLLMVNLSLAGEHIHSKNEEIATSIASQIQPMCSVMRYGARFDAFFDIATLNFFLRGDEYFSSEWVYFVLTGILGFMLIVWIPLFAYTKGVLGVYHQIEGLLRFQVGKGIVTINYKDESFDSSS